MFYMDDYVLNDVKINNQIKLSPSNLKKIVFFY